MIERLTIEWRHLETSGETCLRCSETGKTLQEVIAELREELASRNIEVIFSETKLPADEIAQSNLILINDRPLEDWLPEARASENICSSCCELLAEEVCCRTIEYDGRTYEAIPEELIRQAVYKAFDLEQG